MHGLTESEVKFRREQGLGNNIDLTPSRTYLQIFRKNALTFVNLVLFTIGLLLVLLGSPADAITTAGLVFMNVVIGITQEARAKRKLDQIALLTRPKVTVIRDGSEQAISPSEIVLGDMIVVRSGDQIMCDGQISNEAHIEVDESLLTGESDYVSKYKGDMVYSGSFCVAGTAIYEATKVGRDSLANTITTKARKFDVNLTPLQRSVNTIVRIVSITCITISPLILLNTSKAETNKKGIIQAAAVITGTIPQGLIFLVTLSYALGALRLTRSNTLIQQNNAIESLSHITTLCLDKTGTLTTNEIKLKQLYTHQISETTLKTLIGIITSSTKNHNRTSKAIKKALSTEPTTLTEEVPFSSSRKWSGVIINNNNLQGAYILGAPEILKPHLNQQPQELTKQIETWTQEGLRVILFAHQKDTTSLYNNQKKPELPTRLTPLGLLCLSDELRPDTEETLQQFKEIGIKIKIISGDNPNTVAALAKQAGINTDNKTISGTDLATLDNKALSEAAINYHIFGQITPDQKERLIEALKSNGEYVAMVGDGVNDVPALKKAHIGIAMQSGSPAARNTADIILLNNSFTALPNIFSEGQRIINGIIDTMQLLLTRTTYVLLLISAALLLQLPFPFLPTQDALNSFLTAGLPPILLAIWAQKGQPPSQVSHHIRRFILPAAPTIAFVGLVVYLLLLEENSTNYAQSGLVITVMLCGLALILFIKPPIRFLAVFHPVTNDQRPIWLTTGLLALLLSIIWIEPLHNFFALTPLTITDYSRTLAAVLIWLLSLRSIQKIKG